MLAWTMLQPLLQFMVCEDRVRKHVKWFVMKCSTPCTVPPTIERASQSKEINISEPATLVCLITGFPTPDVVWLKDNEVLSGTVACTISSTGGGGGSELSNSSLGGGFTCSNRSESENVSGADNLNSGLFSIGDLLR